MNSAPSTHRETLRRLFWALLPVLYVAACFVILPDSQFWTGQLNDPDDYMRLARVQDLLNGQGWYDLTQLRLSPGENFILPWSRLVDIPLALVAALAGLFVPPPAALAFAAFLVPLLWLAAFAYVLPGLGHGLIPARRRWLLLLALLSSLVLVDELRPMRVDHHAVQVFFALCAFVTLQLYLLRPVLRWRVLTGLFAACGLAVGAESFLWSLLTIAYVGLAAAWCGGSAARHAAGFAVGFLGGLLAFLLLLRPPSDWQMHDLALPALPHILLATHTAALFALQAAMAARPRWQRCGGLFLSSGLTAALLLFALPELRGGVYAANMSADNHALVLGMVLDVQSFYQRFAGFSLPLLSAYWALIAHNLLLPLLAAVIVAAQLLRSPRRALAFWLLQACFLFPAVLLGLFWQSRVSYYMALYALLPVAWLLAQALRYLTRLPVALRYGLQAAVLLLLPLATVGGIGAVRQLPPLRIVLYPAWSMPEPCNYAAIAAVLNNPRRLPGGPLNLMTDMMSGPELLYLTPHRVFSAPYDVTGNALAFRFFGARDIAMAAALARQQRIGAVLVCDAYAGNYLPDAAAHQAFAAAAFFTAQGQPVPPEYAAARVLIDHLWQGDVPDWLDPVSLPVPGFKLYRVHWTPSP